MSIDNPDKHEIDRWENEGGSCGYAVAEVIKTFDRSSPSLWEGRAQRGEGYALDINTRPPRSFLATLPDGG